MVLRIRTHLPCPFPPTRRRAWKNFREIWRRGVDIVITGDILEIMRDEKRDLNLENQIFGGTMSDPIACPCCSDEGQITWFSGPTYRVICVGCGLSTAAFDSRYEAVQEWNRRTPGPATQAMIKRMREVNEPELPDEQYQSWATNLDLKMVQAFINEWFVSPPCSTTSDGDLI